jgi:hypothetical protein
MNEYAIGTPGCGIPSFPILENVDEFPKVDILKRLEVIDPKL